MNRLCKFTVLRYVPDENRQEFINIGLLFHSPEDGYVNLELTNNFSRVTAFDDEIDIKFLKLVLEGVQSEFTQTLTDGPSVKDVYMPDFLERTTSIYVNQLQFSPIRVIRSQDIQKDEVNLFRTFVYFDANKSKRITDDVVKSIMNRVFKRSDLVKKQNFNRNIELELGPEEIKLDFGYKPKNDNKSKLIKTLSFDYSRNYSNRATQVAKEWAWNYTKIKNNRTNINNPLIKDTEIDLVTLVYIKEENKNIKTALNILKEVSNIVEAKNQTAIEKFADKILEEIN